MPPLLSFPPDGTAVVNEAAGPGAHDGSAIDLHGRQIVCGLSRYDRDEDAKGFQSFRNR